MAKTATRGYSPKKLRELILYLAQRSETDERFGQTKLNKLLYYCDFLAYLELGQPITGARYQRLDHGPGVKAMKPLQREMQQKGALHLREGIHFGYRQVKPIALKEADTTVFSGPEMALVDAVIAGLWDKDATEVSKLSHTDWGWKLAREGETIPYFTALVESIGPV